jgi:hypothetical protein
MRSSSAAAGHGASRGFLLRRPATDRGQHTPYRSEPSLGAGAFAARSGTAQPGVDGCGAGLGVQASDGDLQVRPLIGPLEVGDVRLDLSQVEDALLPGEVREGTKRDAYGRSRTRAFRQSFLVAYALRIGERLSQATVHAEQEAVATSSGQDLLPVLNVRHQAVDDAVDEMFGDGLVYDRAARVSDEEGWHSGLAAADMAALHGREHVTV